MKYFLIAGEASGDLHAAHLMQALLQEDPDADFRFYGGDEMQRVGGKLLCHYKHLAYMGFIPVLLHLRTILRGIKHCKQQIAEWQPDAVILVDYPGFNLKMARYVTQEHICPVFYYISPKIWAWKEHRIKAIRRDVTHLYSILPFEVPYFEQRHNYPITYVGNPTVDEVANYRLKHPDHCRDEHLIALLPGSRRQEIEDNLSRMLQAVMPLREKGFRLAIAIAPSMPQEVYKRIFERAQLREEDVEMIKGDTYGLLSRASAALVTSGTATLETALFRVPQVVCYYVACGRFVSFLRRHLLKVPYISLVNLVCNREVVPELVADGMTVSNVSNALLPLLPGGNKRQEMLNGYEEMAQQLGAPGAPERAAKDIVGRLRK